MDGQMTIFDYLKAKPVSFDDLPEPEMIRQITEMTGLNFVKADRAKWAEYDYYFAKDKGVEYECGYSNYLIDDFRKFIDVGWSYKTSGGGSPCDSVDEAVATLKKYMVNVEKEKKRLEEDRKRWREADGC